MHGHLEPIQFVLRVGVVQNHNKGKPPRSCTRSLYYALSLLPALQGTANEDQPQAGGRTNRRAA